MNKIEYIESSFEMTKHDDIVKFDETHTALIECVLHMKDEFTFNYSTFHVTWDLLEEFIRDDDA
jgi:hypothetical protein